MKYLFFNDKGHKYSTVTPDIYDAENYDRLNKRKINEIVMVGGIPYYKLSTRASKINTRISFSSDTILRLVSVLGDIMHYGETDFEIPTVAIDNRYLQEMMRRFPNEKPMYSSIFSKALIRYLTENMQDVLYRSCDVIVKRDNGTQITMRCHSFFRNLIVDGIEDIIDKENMCLHQFDYDHLYKIEDVNSYPNEATMSQMIDAEDKCTCINGIWYAKAKTSTDGFEDAEFASIMKRILASEPTDYDLPVSFIYDRYLEITEERATRQRKNDFIDFKNKIQEYIQCCMSGVIYRRANVIIEAKDGTKQISNQTVYKNLRLDTADRHCLV